LVLVRFLVPYRCNLRIIQKCECCENGPVTMEVALGADFWLVPKSMSGGKMAKFGKGSQGDETEVGDFHCEPESAPPRAKV
jgi:hypothetical protein